MTRFLPPALLLLSLAPTIASAQAADEGTVVIAIAREPTSPLPTLWQGDGANRELSDLMFLRLMDLGPELSTSNEAGFVPRLARKWERRDSLTLVFELDPRARWHDGRPVTPADVVLGLDRARDPKLSPQVATVLRRIQGVTAEGDRRVVVRFTQAYSEQLYDATYHAPPLPAHLIGGIPAESLATAPISAAPVGNGPFRWVRRVAGQSVELVANERFFLGRPKVRRVILRLAGDAEARINLLLSGEVDAIDNIYALPNAARAERLPAYNYYPIPGLVLSYVNINQRDPADTSRPHPILTDPAVRQALVLGLDRSRIARSVYGAFAATPSAPVSALLGRSVDAPPPPPYDTAAARRLLAGSGWRDADGDGTLEKDGRPLALSLMLPGVVASRRTIAAEMQEAYRRLGIQVNLDAIEAGLYLERRRAGRFDLEIYGVGQDPSPAGLVQSWTCAGIGGSNVSHYCNPAVDSLMTLAIGARRDAGARWRTAVKRLADDYPAIFVAALVSSAAVHRRFENVVLPPESIWSGIWQWRVRPGAQLARDRQ